MTFGYTEYGLKWRDGFRWARFCKLWHTIGLVRNKEEWFRLNAI